MMTSIEPIAVSQMKTRADDLRRQIAEAQPTDTMISSLRESIRKDEESVGRNQEIPVRQRERAEAEITNAVIWEKKTVDSTAELSAQRAQLLELMQTQGTATIQAPKLSMPTEMMAWTKATIPEGSMGNRAFGEIARACGPHATHDLDLNPLTSDVAMDFDAIAEEGNTHRRVHLCSIRTGQHHRRPQGILG